MVYKRVQKKSSSSSPAFTNEASKSKFRQPSFGIQPQIDTDSSPQEIPSNSQGTHKHRSTNLLSKVLENIQRQALTETQPSQLEPEAQADEVSHEAVEIQYQDESGDEDSNSANEGTIQRACSECQSEPEEQKTSSEPPQFYTVQRQSKYLHQKPTIQAKLTIGAPGDKYEQEADSMAARVMSMDTPTTHPQTIQRQGEEQHESIQQQPPVSPFVQRVGELIQRMAEVKASTDETVVNSNKEPLFSGKQDNLESTQLEYLQPKHINRVNARPGTEAIYLDNRSHTETLTTEEPVIQPITDETLQRSGNSDATSATPSLESRLGSQTGGGSPLDEQTRSFMESGFGADFSQVKVHTDTTAVQMNKELGAQAFTHGHDVYFGEGKAPGKNELTAHELTHVVQQGGALRINQQVQLQPEEKAVKSNKPQLSSEKRFALANVIQQLLEFFKPIGEFVAGAVYQWLHNNGEPARWLLQVLIPGWNGLERDVEQGLPKSWTFLAGRAFGDGAALVTGILEIVEGGSGAAGGVTLCLTGGGCVVGAPAIAASTVLGLHGVGTANAAARNIAARLGVVFHSTTGGTSSSGSTPTPVSGVGGNGATSDFGSLNGMTEAQAESFLVGRGAKKTPGTEYDTYTFPDKSKVTIRHSDGRITRNPAPKYDQTGKNLNQGRRLNEKGELVKTRNSDGSQIPGAHDSNEYISRP